MKALREILTNPAKFLAFSRWAAPVLAGLGTGLALIGLWLSFAAPEDYQQGVTLRIMFIHVLVASMAMFGYVCLGIASFLGLVFRQALADQAAQAYAPARGGVHRPGLGRPLAAGQADVGDLVGVGRTPDLGSGALAALSGLHGPAWSAGGRAEGRTRGRDLALVGLINLPVVKFSVEWWNSLHQGSPTLFAKPENRLPPAYAWPMAIMSLSYLYLLGALWLTRIRALIFRRRTRALTLREHGGVTLHEALRNVPGAQLDLSFTGSRAQVSGLRGAIAESGPIVAYSSRRRAPVQLRLHASLCGAA